MVFRCASFLAAVRPSAFLGERFIADLPNHRHSPIEASASLPAVPRPGICNNCQPIAFGSDHHRGITVGVGPWPKKCSRAWWPDPFRSHPKPAETNADPQSHPKALYRGCLPRLARALYHQSTRNISSILSLVGCFMMVEKAAAAGCLLEGKSAYYGRQGTPLWSYMYLRSGLGGGTQHDLSTTSEWSLFLRVVYGRGS